MKDKKISEGFAARAAGWPFVNGCVEGSFDVPSLVLYLGSGWGEYIFFFLYVFDSYYLLVTICDPAVSPLRIILARFAVSGFNAQIACCCGLCCLAFFFISGWSNIILAVRSMRLRVIRHVFLGAAPRACRPARSRRSHNSWLEFFPVFWSLIALRRCLKEASLWAGNACGGGAGPQFCFPPSHSWADSAGQKMGRTDKARDGWFRRPFRLLPFLFLVFDIGLWARYQENGFPVLFRAGAQEYATFSEGALAGSPGLPKKAWVGAWCRILVRQHPGQTPRNRSPFGFASEITGMAEIAVLKKKKKKSDLFATGLDFRTAAPSAGAPVCLGGQWFLLSICTWLLCGNNRLHHLAFFFFGILRNGVSGVWRLNVAFFAGLSRCFFFFLVSFAEPGRLGYSLRALRPDTATPAIILIYPSG